MNAGRRGETESERTVAQGVTPSRAQDCPQAGPVLDLDASGKTTAGGSSSIVGGETDRCGDEYRATPC